MVECHYRDPEGFSAPFGIRTLAKYEPMYNLRASGNPSSWLGPVWGISNYLVWRGLLNYGYETEAGELAEKTISLFGRDLERFGALHEYYDPETGEPHADENAVRDTFSPCWMLNINYQGGLFGVDLDV